MKKLLLVLVIAVSFTANAQIMNCGSFCVLSINNLDTAANTVDVTIWNADTNSVNYPTIVVVDGTGDTVANKSNYFYLFAHLAGDTLTQTIPSDWDSIPTGFTGTVYLTDQIWDTTCAYAYPTSCSVGINEYSFNDRVSIYPNPASDLIHISMEGQKGKMDVTLYDITGKAVRHITGNGELTMDRGELRSGIYFITVDSGNHRMTKKIILY